MKKRSNNFYLSLLFLSLMTSCGFYTTDITGERRRNEDARITFPFGHKKAKSKINPSLEFIEAVKAYRFSVGAFPQSIQQLEYYNERSNRAIKGMVALGFKKMDISYVYLDSMVVDFVHNPVYKQRIGTIDMELDIKGSFMFMVKDSSFFTRTKIK